MKRLPALALLLLAAAGAHAAAPPATPHYFGSAKPPAANILRFNNAAEPEHVDPGLSVGQPDGIICRILSLFFLFIALSLLCRLLILLQILSTHST